MATHVIKIKRPVVEDVEPDNIDLVSENLEYINRARKKWPSNKITVKGRSRFGKKIKFLVGLHK